MESETLGQTVSRIDSERFSLVGAITGDYYQVSLDGGAGWGFFLGGAVALIGLIGSSTLIFRS